MKAISTDLRQRILEVCDSGTCSQKEVATRFCVSHGMVKKLLFLRKRTGSIEPQYFRCGRKPKITLSQREAIARIVTENPDVTLRQIQQTLQLDCTLAAIHVILRALNFTYKKNSTRQRTRQGRHQKSPQKLEKTTTRP